MKKAFYVGMIAGAVLALAGCATLGSTSEQAAEKLVVEYATIKVVNSGKTVAEKQAKAARIIAIASQAQTVLGSPSVTIALVQAAVNAQLAALKLDAADQMLADALVQAVVAEVGDKVGAGVLNPNQVVTVNAVLGWVVEGASFPVS